MPQSLIKSLLLILFTFYCTTTYSQREEIGLDELFERIQNSPDSNVYLENLHVIEDEDSFEESDDDDSADTIVIEKNVRFENVVFEVWELANIAFKGNVEFKNSIFMNIRRSVFEQNLIVKIEADALLDIEYSMGFTFSESMFYGSIDIQIDHANFEGFLFEDNEIHINKNLSIVKKGIGRVNTPGVLFAFENIYYVHVSNNFIEVDEVPVSFIFLGINGLNFESNTIDNEVSFIRIYEVKSISLFDNNFKHPIILSDINIKSTDYVKWTDFQNNIVSSKSYQNIFLAGRDFRKSGIDSIINHYVFKDEFSYNNHVSLLGRFNDFYKSQHNRDWGNLVFQDIKDLETQRFKFLYQNDKTFRNYFQLKINQFLKVFSDYGTRPSKAIIIALYVIFFFALFYFFFPNSWDENNRHRVMNRMLFFTKYFKRSEGMKEVYEEERKAQIMAYEDFKSFITESKNEIPPYFVALSKPIYAFSVANFKIRSKFLSKADILKGKWVDLKPSRKVVTSVIMAFWLLGILLYDVFVKFFNALMLSINTFSTLGFGEIPIKGIARYLAILQGFLGWFMLSIFSVSLISQLLN